MTGYDKITFVFQPNYPQNSKMYTNPYNTNKARYKCGNNHSKEMPPSKYLPKVKCFPSYPLLGRKKGEERNDIRNTVKPNNYPN